MSWYVAIVTKGETQNFNVPVSDSLSSGLLFVDKRMSYLKSTIN